MEIKSNLNKKFKLKCKNCQQKCLDCYEEIFHEKPKKNKFKLKAVQTHVELIDEKELLDVPAKKDHVVEGSPKKDRKEKKKNKKNKPHKCFEKKCDVCRNSSCCSYQDKGKKLLNFECRNCQENDLHECVDCYNNCFNSDVIIPFDSSNSSQLFTVQYKKKFKKKSAKKSGKKGGKVSKKMKKKLQSYFENDKSNKHLEEALMKRAKKQQKKINKKMYKQQKKNKKMM